MFNIFLDIIIANNLKNFTYNDFINNTPYTKSEIKRIISFFISNKIIEKVKTDDEQNSIFSFKDEDLTNEQINSLVLSDISLNKLEMIQKNIIFLETKYEEFAELSNCFDPIFIEIKKQIHIDEVSKIREENRKKREGK